MSQDFTQGHQESAFQIKSPVFQLANYLNLKHYWPMLLGAMGFQTVPFSMSSILSHTGTSHPWERAHHLCSSGALLVPRSPLPRFHLSFSARKLSSSIKAQSKLPLPVRSPRVLLAQHPDLLLFRNTTVMLGLRWEAGRGLAVKVHLQTLSAQFMCRSMLLCPSAWFAHCFRVQWLAFQGRTLVQG